MSQKRPLSPKTTANPGYAGYIPGSVSDNNFAKTFARVSREQLTREKYLPERVTQYFPNRPFTTTSIGRTLYKFGGGLDDEYHRVSHFHGQATIPKEHPNVANHNWDTTYRSTFLNQEKERPRLYRSTNSGFWKNTECSKRPSTQASGFVQNSTLFDGHGWLPVKEMHGNMRDTEYRKRYNPEVPFHPVALKPNERKLKKRGSV
mmetsp:Transcript_32108/g.31859  ORF Transcript_32108/g.31859 Transcript_32108/m.31859 type:complete len:204 (+) Transcript_32108:155-766(+)